MCSKKDIDTILEQLQLCHDRAEKKNLLKELDVCGNCLEKSSVDSTEKAHCHCQEIEHVEILNLIEHIRQGCMLKGAKGNE
ncbi:MAG: hypothetical protein F9K32_06040 [Desulfobulbaceae bacterium]|nr:MAG: hypothetical protein F9K32_06040 [Desulfobulbaceae bacterium]